MAAGFVTTKREKLGAAQVEQLFEQLQRKIVADECKMRHEARIQQIYLHKLPHSNKQ
jgi:hypothetical protein